MCNNDKGLIRYTFFWSAAFIAAGVVACFYTGEGLSVFESLRLIFFSPSKLVTDYFNLGSLGATFINAGLCGFFCNIAMLACRAKPRATLLAGYFLVVAHCFYGLNLINMLPPFLGVLLYFAVRREKAGEQLHLAMFATSLGPFISDFLFRYTLGNAFVFGEVHVTVWGVLLAVLFSAAAGFLIPALLPGTAKMHRGFNLFKAGLAIGLFGMFAYALFYKVFGVETPDVLIRENAIYEAHGNSYLLFMDIFFAAVFLATGLFGFIGNGCSFKGYRAVFDDSGHDVDFLEKYGLPRTFLNIGIYGFSVLLYWNLIILLTEGAGFTGATAGVTIAAITFSAAGQTPKNVWPIAAGYLLLFGAVYGITALFGTEMSWTVSTQAYVNGMAFATGLCPFTGKYGRRIGLLAGALDAILCTLTVSMHGGFVLYNGGFTAGLTALLLIPILDFYKVKMRAGETDR